MTLLVVAGHDRVNFSEQGTSWTIGQVGSWTSGIRHLSELPRPGAKPIFETDHGVACIS
jgi:hypothetical protein